MENKHYFKKNTILIFFVTAIFLSMLIVINKYEYKQYNKNFNYKISAILHTIEEEYPNISRQELIRVLQSENINEFSLKEYGYDIDKDIYVSENTKVNNDYRYIKVLLLLSFSGIMVSIFIKLNKERDNDIDKIIKCIENINHKNYELNIEDISEGKLSILKEEIYKTTIMLKENAENSLKDKIHLKMCLEDISHQIKTPLTSINILLDNIIDNPDMSNETQEKFLRQIRREINNITFLVQSLLKLSQFETNTIVFNKNKVTIKELLERVIQNVSNLCDLKNITIKVDNKCKNKINCSFKWQTEALTNILKNAVDYSYANSEINIECRENNLYTEIRIIDYGKGMTDIDKKNLFKRFYKGKDANDNSVGIGLSLAKTIIEKDKGKIEVVSKKEKGTTFIIKYYI